MTREEAVEQVVKLSSAFPKTPLEDLSIATYADNLVDLDADAVALAVVRLIRTSTFLPVIAEIRQSVVDAGIKMPDPEEAYGLLYEAIHDKDKREGLHPAITEAVRLIGHDWEALGLLQYDQYPWMRRDFLAAYRELSNRWRTEAQTSGQVPLLPSREEARELLSDLSKQMVREVRQ